MAATAFRFLTIPTQIKAPVVNIAVRCNDLPERVCPIAINSSTTHVVSGPSGNDCSIRRLCEEGAGQPLFFKFSQPVDAEGTSLYIGKLNMECENHESSGSQDNAPRHEARKELSGFSGGNIASLRKRFVYIQGFLILGSLMTVTKALIDSCL